MARITFSFNPLSGSMDKLAIEGAALTMHHIGAGYQDKAFFQDGGADALAAAVIPVIGFYRLALR